MKFIKLKILLASMVALFAFSGCTAYEQQLIANSLAGNHASNNGYNNEHNSNTYYRYGSKDGCKSKQRGYTIKNRYRWNNYSSYRNGWYAGYRQCRKPSYNRNYYNRGYNDGCWSSRHRGTRKNHSLYNRYNSYKTGWKKGYRSCRRR